MNLPLDLVLNDKPDIEIQHQAPLTMEISHIVQTMSGKNLLLLLFMLLLIVDIIAIIIVYSNTKWTKNIQYLFFLHYTLGVFSIYHN